MIISDQLLQYYEEQKDTLRAPHEKYGFSKSLFEKVWGMFLDILGRAQTDMDIITSLKLFNNIWNYVVVELEKRGFPYLKKDGFRVLIESKVNEEGNEKIKEALLLCIKMAWPGKTND